MSESPSRYGAAGDDEWPLIRPRRIVIGYDDGGRAAVTFDDYPGNVGENASFPGIASNMLWKEGPKVDRDSREDGAVVWREVPVPIDGTRFFMITIAAGSVADMHTTPSVEYHYIISGAIIVTLDDGAEVEARGGDVIVMRGVAHGWRNPFDEPYVSVGVMVGMHSAFGENP
ncbi:cupin domain-containing protein [Glaciibacter sp. 2TAF33]|uniref:cupin domain-containing protein n=1 Tax=Glaciibacter sp. 2TAF33 TaxID=3233015 RepID=UPI003F9293A1